MTCATGGRLGSSSPRKIRFDKPQLQRMNDKTETIEIADWRQLPANPLVSVVMATYLHEKFIAQAIEGVVAQQCDFSIELIIGEDCSPDRTRDIVLEYQRRYPQLIRVLTSKRNVGMHANGDRCGKACRGKFVAACEGDDFWNYPRKLALQVQTMERDRSIGFCHTDIDQQLGRITLHSVNALRKPKHIAHGADAYTSLLLEWTPTTATTMYRRDILEAFKSSMFNRTDWPFGDYSCALYASVNGSVAYLPLSTATWREVSGSSTNSGCIARLRMGLALAECRECFMASYPLPIETAEKVRAGSHRRIMADAFVARDEALYLSSWKWLVEHHFKPSKIAHGFRLAILKLHVPSKLILMGKKIWRLRRLRLILHVVTQLIGIDAADTRPH